MPTDWKDALAALKGAGSLPEGEPAGEPAPVAEPARVQPEPVDIILDRKGRKGKVATIIEGLRCDDDTTAGIARRLKQAAGCGGSWLPGEILLQGDRREAAAALLRSLGYKCRVR